MPEGPLGCVCVLISHKSGWPTFRCSVIAAAGRSTLHLGVFLSASTHEFFHLLFCARYLLAFPPCSLITLISKPFSVAAHAAGPAHLNPLLWSLLPSHAAGGARRCIVNLLLQCSLLLLLFFIFFLFLFFAFFKSFFFFFFFSGGLHRGPWANALSKESQKRARVRRHKHPLPTHKRARLNLSNLGCQPWKLWGLCGVLMNCSVLWQQTTWLISSPTVNTRLPDWSLAPDLAPCLTDH